MTEGPQMYENIDGKWIPVSEEDGSPARAIAKRYGDGKIMVVGLTPTAKRKIKEMAEENKRKLRWVKG